MKNIISFVALKINSISSGSIVVDSSLIFNQDISKDIVSQALKNAMLIDNTLNIISFDIDPSSPNSKLWLPLVIALPTIFFLLIVSLAFLVYYKKQKLVSIFSVLLNSFSDRLLHSQIVILFSECKIQ